MAAKSRSLLGLVGRPSRPKAPRSRPLWRGGEAAPARTRPGIQSTALAPGFRCLDQFWINLPLIVDGGVAPCILVVRRLLFGRGTCTARAGLGRPARRRRLKGPPPARPATTIRIRETSDLTAFRPLLFGARCLFDGWSACLPDSEGFDKGVPARFGGLGARGARVLGWTDAGRNLA
jgi:hypothetical protein